MTRKEYKEKRGKELHQSYKTKIKSTAGHGIHMPADGNPGHLQGHTGRSSRCYVYSEGL
jgi:hypothetical protein